MSARAGATTVELIVALTVAGILSASIGTLLRRQQRFYARAANAVEHRVSLRDATSILPAELRALSPVGGDVVAFSDSSLDIRATIGAAVVCDVGVDGYSLDLVPGGLAGSTVLAAFSTTPQPGDIALTFDAGLPDEPRDDRWIDRDVASVSTRDDACVASPLVSDALASIPRLRIGLGDRVPETVRSGTFAHVVRRVRYRLYRASAGDWYLGYAEWAGAGFSVIQPVSGPFASYSRSAMTTGLLLRYYDADGAVLSSTDDVSRITRVEVVARSAAAGGLSEDGAPSRDAQDITVRMRNR